VLPVGGVVDLDDDVGGTVGSGKHRVDSGQRRFVADQRVPIGVLV
jgi:hypothetical protein